MKKILLFLVSCLVFLMFPFSSMAESAFGTASDVDFPAIETPYYIEGELIVWTNVYVEPVTCKDGESVDFFGVDVACIEPLFSVTDRGVSKWSVLSKNKFPYCLQLSDDRNAVNAAETLAEESCILEIDYNYVIDKPIENKAVASGSKDSVNSGTGVDYTQWAHEYLSVNSVWEMGFCGSASIKVAVLDTGFVEHVDLQDNLDMSLAYDVYYDDTDVTTANSHGNRVAGIIGADFDDGGVNGICQNVTMIPIKIANDTTATSTASAQLKGINKAIELGADIINLSFSMSTYSELIIQTIEDNNILFVTSADNDGVDITNGSGCKRNDSPNWIVVGAMTEQEEKRSNSNYSSIYVDLFAPGENNWTTSINNDYDYIGHTSGATPHVTAACALLMSVATHKTPLQIRQLLLDNVKEIDGFDEYCVTGGTLSIVNAINALYEENRGAYTKGDVSGDGYVDEIDYLFCKRICLNTLTPSDAQLNAADVDGNGTVNAVDYIFINRYCGKTYYFAPF